MLGNNGWLFLGLSRFLSFQISTVPGCCLLAESLSLSPINTQIQVLNLNSTSAFKFLSACQCCLIHCSLAFKFSETLAWEQLTCTDLPAGRLEDCEPTAQLPRLLLECQLPPSGNVMLFQGCVCTGTGMWRYHDSGVNQFPFKNAPYTHIDSAILFLFILLYQTFYLAPASGSWFSLFHFSETSFLAVDIWLAMLILFRKF